VPNCKSFLVTEAERKHVRLRARFQQHRDTSCHNFFFFARQGAEENSRHSDRNISVVSFVGSMLNKSQVWSLYLCSFPVELRTYQHPLVECMKRKEFCNGGGGNSVSQPATFFPVNITRKVNMFIVYTYETQGVFCD